MAVAETFRTLKNRLVILKETTREESVEESLDFFFSFFDDDEVEDEQENDNVDQLYTREKVNEFIQHEIDEIDDIINTAEKIKKNAKMTALKTAVRKAFDFQRDAGIKEKVVIFTESVRTQQYIFEELSEEGYQGQILKFNGSSGDDTTKELFRAWRNRNYGKYFGSRNVELKNAIVQAFKEDYKILLVTDSGSEGLNLQFCNTIINYDLPWNPQKIEQRIGRCHRYGQKNDVVVFNLLNTQNVADKRVYEILSNKFELFQGVFGASDRAIGLLESGADFEKRVSHIYQECKTSKDFLKEFTSLERELDRKRNKKMEQLKSLIIREAPEQHKETFERILSDIQGYQNQLDYWGKVNISHKQVIYPRFYKLINGLNIPGIEHGYLLIGVYYAGEELIQSVFQVSDEKGKIYAAKDELIRILTSSLTDEAYNRLEQNIKDYVELKEMEYNAITHHQQVEFQHDVRYFKAEEVAIKDSLKKYFSRVIKLHRLREVKVLLGYSRLEMPEPEVDDQKQVVKLKSSGPEKWLPAVEINGEGIFIEFNRATMNEWLTNSRVAERSKKYESCYEEYCKQKGWENFKSRNGEYVLIHTLSHMLIKEMAIQSGYSSSALHERIYSSDKMCGLLIYTGVADKEGSLGGLVELGSMEKLIPLLKGALENGLTCTTDPECFMKNPTTDRINGAACHSCTMISETACENGNRLLDRALVVPLPEHEEMGYFKELVNVLCGIQV